MRYLLALILSATLLFSSLDAAAWGSKSHDIICQIATNHLTPKAKKAVDRLLGGYTMVYYSTWMDNVRFDPQFNDTDMWHYANVNDGETYETMPKNPGGDVYVALNLIVSKLKSGEYAANKEREATFLKFLIHLVGDLHCPMHVGHLDDAGGNKFPIRWFRTETNLHAMWDDLLIDNIRKWSYTEWVANIDRVDAAQQATIAAGTILDWLNESVEVCATVYEDTGINAYFDYYNIGGFYDRLELQLLRAGYRLARLINEIYG